MASSHIETRLFLDTWLVGWLVGILFCARVGAGCSIESHMSALVALLFKQSLTKSGTQQLGYTFWTVNPRDPPISTSSVLGLLVYTITSKIFFKCAVA